MEDEDEDEIRIRNKACLHQSSPHIMEDDSDDDQVLLECMNYKETKDASSIPKTPA
jgi:hypothetical protein